MTEAYNPATDVNSPAYVCASYQEMMLDVELVNDCYVGTRAVNKKEQEYLPMYGAESDGDYAARLKASKFWNAFRRTVNGLVGLIFRKNPVLQDDVPAIIAEHLENVDLQGTHFDVFSKERCTKGMTDGHSFIFVDMPQPVTEENPAATREDETGIRPKWVGVNKNQIINFSTENIRGVETLTQVVIWERVKERRGRFGEEIITQYRVLEPGRWEIWRQGKEGEKFELYDEGEFRRISGAESEPLPYIPLVPFYAMQTGFFESTPPLLDVAHENLRHYRLQSSLDRVLDLCNIPTPVLKGRPNPDEPLIVGATVIDVPENGDAKFLEPTGAAIECTQNEIDRCKVNIASLGLLLLSGQPKVAKTATETVAEDTAEKSELAAITRRFQDCVEQCAAIHADYLGLPTGGSIKMNRDFVRMVLEAQRWQRLQDDVAGGRLTLETYWQILENHEELPEDFDAKKEKAVLDAEKDENASLTNRMFNQFDRGVDAGAGLQ